MSGWVQRESRRIEKATTLIRKGVPHEKAVWADLGCGDGIFTAALAGLLPPGSEIHAVDRNAAALRQLTRNFAASFPHVRVHPIQADFFHELPLPSLAGIVMANALHFVERKPPVLAGITNFLQPGGRFILVEYNTSTGNRWVPHPVDERRFPALAEAAGLENASILEKIPSRFLGEMYAGIGYAPNPSPG